MRSAAGDVLDADEIREQGGQNEDPAAAQECRVKEDLTPEVDRPTKAS